MTCATFDLACHFWTITGPVWTFVDTWFPLATFIAGLIIGGILGWRVVLATLTLGIGYLIYDRFRPRVEPDYETGEPPAAKPAKTKRKTIF